MPTHKNKLPLPGERKELRRIWGESSLAGVPVLVLVATGISTLLGGAVHGILYFVAAGLGGWGVWRKHRVAVEKVPMESQQVLLESGASIIREAILLCANIPEGPVQDSAIAVTIYEVPKNVRRPLVQVTREIGGDFREADLEIGRGIGAVGRAAGGGPLGDPSLVIGNRTADNLTEFRRELNQSYGMPMELVLKVRQNMQSWMAIPILEGKRARYVVFLDSDTRGFFEEINDEAMGNTAHALKLTAALSDYISR